MKQFQIHRSILTKSFFVLLFFFYLTFSTSPSVHAASHTFYAEMKPSVRGEYNISINGTINGMPKLYKVNLFKKLVQVPCSYIWKSGARVLKCSLEKKTTYRLYLTTSGSKPAIQCKKNLDTYSTSTLKCPRGVQWTPYSNSYQEFSLQGIRTIQIAYLTREEALLYSLNLSRNSYLKLINTSIKLTQFMTSCGISSSSALGKKILSIGKTKLATVAKTIVSTFGGITLLPNMSKTVQEAVKIASSNYTRGIKIVVTSTSFGGFSNSYSGWNQQYNTVVGKSGVRGSFSTTQKLKGWY